MNSKKNQLSHEKIHALVTIQREYITPNSDMALQHEEWTNGQQPLFKQQVNQ